MRAWLAVVALLLPLVAIGRVDSASGETDHQRPSTPEEFGVTASSGTSVSVAWKASTDNVGVVGYHLYQDGLRITSTPETSSDYSELVCGTAHTFAVEAYDAAGNRSLPASLVAATAPCPDVGAPSVPAGLAQASASETTVTLTWQASTDNVDVVGYGVYRDGSRIGTTAQTDYVVAGLLCGTAYTMAVDAYDAAGNRSSATEVVVTTSPCATTDTQPPSVPSNQAVSGATQTSFTMTWSASTDNIGVTGYNVYLNNVRVTTVPGLSYTYMGLTCGTTYTVGLEARDAAGNVSSRAQASGSASTATCNQPPPTDTQPPTVPTGLTVTGSTQTTVSLSWNPSTDNVGVTGYGIYRAGVRAATEVQTSYTLAGLTCGTSVTVGIDASDAAGNRSSIASLIATTGACSDTQPPSTPASLALTSRTQTSISIVWAASTDNVGVTGYGVYRNGTRIGTTQLTTSTFTGLTCGTSYTLGVDAADAAGNRSPQATVLMSTTACSTGDTQPPSVPANQAISTVTRTSFTMTWSASTDNVGVTGYNVYLNNVRVTTVPGLSYTYTGLTCATTYTVGLEARDAAGNVSNRAQATAPATTQSCLDTPPPTGGQVYLSPSGSDSNPCSAAAPCRSLDRAYDLAAPGDVIELACGAYGSQSVTGTKGDPGVVFRSASSRCAGVSLDMYGQNAEFRSIDFSGFWLWGARDVTIADSDVGPLVNVVPYVAHSQSGSIVPSRNIVLEGNRFHDITTTGDNHGECLMVQGADGIVIRGNTWSNCNYFDIFITWWSFAPGNTPPTNGVIENNFFEPATRGGFFSVRFAGYPQRWSNWTVRNNSSTQTMSWGDSGTQHSNFVVTGNAMPMASYNCPSDVSFSYNVVTGSRCTSNDRLVGDLGFVSSTDFRLRSGSPAIDAGNPGNFAATDIDGRARPLGAAPDAGAHEAG